MSKTYDVIIIGGGIGGLMAAYGLRSRDAKLRVAILEKGRPVEQRSCPASKGKGCVYCPVCSITSGFAGAGAFSDGKFNLGTAYGGTLGEELGETLAMTYIGAVSRVLDRFTPEGIEIKEYGSNEALKLKCLQNNLRLLDMNVKHLGTDNNLLIMQNLIQWLGENGVDLVPNTEVTHVARSEDGYVLSTQREEYRADTPYWHRRLSNWVLNIPCPGHLVIAFSRGYRKPDLYIEASGINIYPNRQHPDWGEPTGSHYVIALKRRVQLNDNP